VIGYYDETQTTAGTHSAALSLVQGAGGNNYNLLSESVYQSSVDTLSGTSRTLNVSPANFKIIYVQIDGMDTSSTSVPILRLGTAGAAVVTGYNGAGSTGTSVSNGSTGASLGGTHTAAYVKNGMLTLARMGTSNKWAISGTIKHSEAGQFSTTGYIVDIGGNLDTLVLTMIDGTSTFNAGSWSWSGF